MGVCETVTHRSKAKEEVPLFLSEKLENPSMLLKHKLPIPACPSGLPLAPGVAGSSRCRFRWRWRRVWEGKGTRPGHRERRGPAWQPSITARGWRWAPCSCALPHGDGQDSRGFTPASWLPRALLWPPAASPRTHRGRMIVFEQGQVRLFSLLPYCLQKYLSRSRCHRKPLSRQKGEEQSG